MTVIDKMYEMDRLGKSIKIEYSSKVKVFSEKSTRVRVKVLSEKNTRVKVKVFMKILEYISSIFRVFFNFGFWISKAFLVHFDDILVTTFMM